MKRDNRAEALRAWLVEHIVAKKRIPVGLVQPDMSFNELGLDSVEIAVMTEDLASAFGVHVDPLEPYEHVTISSLADHLVSPNR